MKAKLTFAILCALTLGGCTLAVHDGGHRRGDVPHHYQKWHDQEWRHQGWREPSDRHDRYDRHDGPDRRW